MLRHDAAMSDLVNQGGPRYRFEALLTAEMPPGWMARESIELLSREAGTHVAASGEPLPPAVVLETYVQRYEEALERQLPTYRQTSLEPVELFGGRPGMIRRFRWNVPNGDEVRQVQAYCIVDHWGYVLTATLPPTEEDESSVIELLQGIRIRPRPAGAVGASIEGATSPFDRYARGEVHLSLADGDDAAVAGDPWETARHGWSDTLDEHR